MPETAAEAVPDDAQNLDMYGLGPCEMEQIVTFGKHTGTVASMLNDERCPVGKMVADAYTADGIVGVEQKLAGLQVLDSGFKVMISKATRDFHAGEVSRDDLFKRPDPASPRSTPVEKVPDETSKENKQSVVLDARTQSTASIAKTPLLSIDRQNHLVDNERVLRSLDAADQLEQSLEVDTSLAAITPEVQQVVTNEIDTAQFLEEDIQLPRFLKSKQDVESIGGELSADIGEPSEHVQAQDAVGVSEQELLELANWADSEATQLQTVEPTTETWMTVLRKQPLEAYDTVMNALADFIRPLESLEQLERPQDHADLLHDEAVATQHAAARILERMAILEGEQKLVAADIMQTILGTVHGLHVMKEHGQDEQLILETKAKLAGLISELSDVLGIALETEDVQRLVTVLMELQFAHEPSNEADAAVIDLQHVGTHEGMHPPRQFGVNLLDQERAQRVLGLFTLWCAGLHTKHAITLA